MFEKSIYKRLLFGLIGYFLLFIATIIIGINMNFPIDAWLLISFISFTLFLPIVLKQLLFPLNETFSAIKDGVDAFKDKDFSITIQNQEYKEIGRFVKIYNDLATTLRSERMGIFQRELLLDTVIQSTPVALVLTDRKQNIVYSNTAARELLQVNQQLKGLNFTELMKKLSSALLSATEEKHNGLVTEYANDQSIVYNVNCQDFMLNGRVHNLYLYKNLSSELSRKENDMWKQVIRLISHELNNSLAPISSLTNSAKKIIKQPEHIDMLEDVLDTIGNRTQHLNDFISHYAEFAKMPKPSIKKVKIATFFKQIETLCDVKCDYDVLSEEALFDDVQLEQVIINLVKNAKESGSDINEVGFDLSQQGHMLTFSVYDRGTGLSEAQMQQALLPFYTTKAHGTGVGLALCNEIVMAHGGKLRLFNRDHGGLCVSFSLDMRI